MIPVLEMEHVTKIYGAKGGATVALNDVSLRVMPGEFIAVMGPSGAGKSTLLNLAGMLDQPTSGSVFLEGLDMQRMKKEGLAMLRRQKLGFILQEANLLATLTLKENMLLPLLLAKMPVEEMESRVAYLAERLGLQRVLEHFPQEVSGGERQRTAAARAVIHRPRLVLADEPTGALDSKATADLLRVLTELNEEYQTTLLLVTHDPFAASYAKRILFIKDGLVFTELRHGGDRREFFQRILDVLAMLGGDGRDLI